jgi:hypothetical protein
MENVELLNALMSDPEVRKLLVKLSKNDTVNTVLNSGYAQQPTYYPANNNSCYPNQGGNQSFGLGGLGLLFLIPLLFCGCGGGFGSNCGCGGGFGFGRGFGFNNRCCNPCDCYDRCDCCCEFWC